VPPAFDAQGESVLKAFTQQTSFEEDIVGKNIILVDKDASHVTDAQFGVQSWAFADGSTLSIVGIIPIAAQTGFQNSVHAGS
jgi:hypothetical protein